MWMLYPEVCYADTFDNSPEMFSGAFWIGGNKSEMPWKCNTWVVTWNSPSMTLSVFL